MSQEVEKVFPSISFMSPLRLSSQRQQSHMAGSSQPQNFFAAGCLFADFAIAFVFRPVIRNL